MYTVLAMAGANGKPITIENLLVFLNGTQGPQDFPFGSLGNVNARFIPMQGTGETLDINPAHPDLAKAIGLISCACVIFQNKVQGAPNGEAYIYHAASGVLSANEIGDALGAINWQNNGANIRVVFAHPDGASPGYITSLNNIVNAGIPTNQIIEIMNLSINTFGMNNNGLIGY